MEQIYKSDFSKPGIIPEWPEINPHVSNNGFVAENGAGKLTKDVAGCPCRRLDMEITADNYALIAVPSNFARLNMYVQCADYQNYIMVFTSGNGVYCAVKRNNTWANIGNSGPFPVANGDELMVEVLRLSPLIVVSFVLNGERKYSWAINESPELMIKGVAVQAESQNESFLDSLGVVAL